MRFLWLRRWTIILLANWEGDMWWSWRKTNWVDKRGTVGESSKKITETAMMAKVAATTGYVATAKWTYTQQRKQFKRIHLPSSSTQHPIAQKIGLVEPTRVHQIILRERLPWNPQLERYDYLLLLRQFGFPSRNTQNIVHVHLTTTSWYDSLDQRILPRDKYYSQKQLNRSSSSITSYEYFNNTCAPPSQFMGEHIWCYVGIPNCNLLCKM